MKNIYFLSFAVVLFFIVSCGDSNDSIENNEVYAKPVGEESFWGLPIDCMPKTDKEFASKWVVSKGNWKLVDGKLETIKNDIKDPEHIILFKKNMVGDYAIEFKASIKSKAALEAGGDLSIIMAGNASLEKRYDVQVGGVGNKYAIIQMYNLPITQLPYEIIPCEVYKIRVEKMGDSLSLYCNDIMLLSCRNKYFLTGRLNGIYAYGEGKQFWDIKVYEKKMRGFDVELESVDRLLSRIIESPAKYSRYAETVRSMYNETLKAYLYEATLNDIIHLRLAHLELAMDDFNEFDRHLSKIKSKDNVYDVLLLKARAAFMRGDFVTSKKLFTRCFAKFKLLRVGTVVYLKKLLHSKYAKKLTQEYQIFFWNTYVTHTLDSKKNFNNSNLKTLSFLNNTDPTSNYFDFESNDLSSLAPLAAFNKLNYLSLNGNRNIVDLKELNNKATRALKISDTKIVSLDGIIRTDLTKLELQRNNLNDLSILKDCVNMKYLDIRHNNLKSISELSPLQSLSTFQMGHNQIEDISPVNYEHVRILMLENNNIINIDVLKKAETLSTINLSNNKITSLEPLAKLTKLTSVTCVNNPLKTLGGFSIKPPETLFFDIDAMDDKYLNTLKDNWSVDEYKHHKRNLEILIELKKGDKADIKKFATKHLSHAYLSVPLFLNLKEAHVFCEKFGGHLLSIVVQDENGHDLIDRMPHNHWIGLERVDDIFRWSTNEVVDVDNSLVLELDQNPKDRYYAINGENRWVTVKPEIKLPFIIEWDEK